MRRSLIAAVALAALACDRAPASESYTWRSAVAPGRAIQVRNLNGPIHVEAADDGQVEVTAVKRSSGRHPQEVRFLTGTDDAGAYVCAVWGRGGSCDRQGTRGSGSRRSVWARLLGGGGGEVSVAFTVRVPSGVRVDVGTTNGEVRVEGVHGGVNARTVNGAVHVAASSGPISVSTVNGSVVATVDSLDPGAPLSLKSVNGSVTAELPEGIDAALEMSTVNGRVTADFPVTIQGSVSPKRLQGTLGGGGREIRLETVNGSVKLRKRGAASD